MQNCTKTAAFCREELCLWMFTEHLFRSRYNLLVKSTITACEPVNWWVTSIERLPNCQGNSTNQNYWFKALYFQYIIATSYKLDLDR